MYDGAVGHDCVVPLQQVQLTLVVLSSIRQAIDRAALRAGADGHARYGLAATHTVHCACMTCNLLRLLQK